ncbi:ABC transporter ATP-binding protein [Clostridium paridis]|uniref:ABC transporter ATP-binding protein n=1 Tax=Clostridium paridis TaxID=2803863 RepID=UPI00308403FE
MRKVNALEIKNLSKNFGNFKLEDINLELPKGYILGYIGQNGAGKTTTIKLIMEQLKRDNGQITVMGKSYIDNEEAYKEMIGYIADECYYPECFNINDILGSLKDFYPTFNEEKFISYINTWELPKKTALRKFSKGMKLKLMFATVLSRDTKLLVLDEPTSGLDPVIRSEILEILQDYISDGERSVMFSTHIMSDLEKIADYLYFIDKGKTIFYDSKDNIVESYLIVKGGNEDLTDEREKKLIGCKKSNIGFEGLIHSSDAKYFKDGFLIERPRVDDIVVFHIKGVRGKR